jgi:hypothetical protein
LTRTWALATHSAVIYCLAWVILIQWDII